MLQSLTNQISLFICSLIVCLMGWQPGSDAMANTQQHPTISSNLTDANTFYMVRDYLERIAELKQIIQISVTESSKKNVLELIAAKADLGIAYNAELESLKQTVTIERDRITVGDALMLVLKDTDYEPIISRTREIVLTRVKAEEAAEVELAFDEELQETVQGQVTDAATGGLLPGVNVAIQGTTIGTSTDIDGNYELELPSEDVVLVFSFIGYTTQQIQLDGRTQIDVELQRGIDQLEELVVVGYGQQQRRDLTGSISSVPREDIVQVAVYSMDNVLQGRAAGVDIIADGFRPGESSTIRIRGERSLVAGNDPLIVMDGVPIDGGLMDLNPRDVESVEILKDASATAIYGSRGANGVILVTTRQGQTGQVQIEYSGEVGLQRVANTLDVMNAERYVEMQREAARAEGQYTTDEALFSDWELEGIRNGIDTDWQDVVFGDGMQQSHQLSVRGGTENTRYMLSGNMLEHLAIVDNNDFTRFVGRINVDQRVTDNFRAGISGQVTTSRQHRGGDFTAILQQSPIDWPGRAEEQATPGVRAVGENFPLLNLDRDRFIDRRDRTRLIGNVYAIIDNFILDGFSYRMNFAPDMTFAERGTHSWFGSDASVSNDRATDILFENIIDFDRDITANHRLRGTALYSIHKNEQFGTSVSVRDLPFEQQRFYNIGTAEETRSRGSYLREWTLESYMLRLNYSYRERYLFTVTGRMDGSSRLAEGNKYGLFPSAAVAWLLVDEPFMADQTFFSELKLRVSYGDVGNTGIQPYQTQGRVSRLGYSFGDTSFWGFENAELANADLRWERTRQLDIGLDWGVLDHRISGTFGIYQQDTFDLIMNRQLPPTSGFTSTLENVGSTRNRGLEISLSTINYEPPGGALRSGFRWTTDIHFHTNRTEIVELFGGTEDDPGNAWFIGHPINVHYDHEFIGIWQPDEADLAESYGQSPGDIRVRDVTGDGRIGAGDRVILGSEDPDWSASLSNRISYRGFDFSFLVYTTQGRMIFSDAGSTSLSGFINLRRGYNYNSLNVNYYTPDNPSTQYPRPRLSGHPYFTPMGYFDGSFVRVRNITLGYTLPPAWINQIGIRNARIHTAIQNPFTWTNDFPGLDPEGAEGHDMPNYRTFLVGFEVGF